MPLLYSTTNSVVVTIMITEVGIEAIEAVATGIVAVTMATVGVVAINPQPLLI
jgi:hypothetical protein